MISIYDRELLDDLLDEPNSFDHLDHMFDDYYDEYGDIAYVDGEPAYIDAIDWFFNKITDKDLDELENTLSRDMMRAGLSFAY